MKVTTEGRDQKAQHQRSSDGGGLFFSHFFANYSPFFFVVLDVFDSLPRSR